MQHAFRKSENEGGTHGHDPAYGHPHKKEAAEHVHGPDCNHEPQAPYVRPDDKIGRNDPCTCGSGKKYKKCCGAAG